LGLVGTMTTREPNWRIVLVEVEEGGVCRTHWRQASVAAPRLLRFLCGDRGEARECNFNVLNFICSVATVITSNLARKAKT